MAYSRASCLPQLLGVALEVADKARASHAALPDLVVLNPAGLGCTAPEIQVTSAEERYLPEILLWARAATAEIKRTLQESAGVYLRGPTHFTGQGARTGTSVRTGPGEAGGGVQATAELQTLMRRDDGNLACFASVYV